MRRVSKYEVALPYRTDSTAAINALILHAQATGHAGFRQGPFRHLARVRAVWSDSSGTPSGRTDDHVHQDGLHDRHRLRSARKYSIMAVSISPGTRNL